MLYVNENAEIFKREIGEILTRNCYEKWKKNWRGRDETRPVDFETRRDEKFLVILKNAEIETRRDLENSRNLANKRDENEISPTPTYVIWFFLIIN